jgi:DNA-binding NarL/FixJ family response regulator
MTRVLIVDDHSFFRRTLADLIGASGDLEVVGQCGDGAEVTTAVTALRPDVILMDVRMGHVSGIDAAQSLKQQGSGARVIMLSSDDRSGTRAAARDAGAVGYLVKGGHLDEVLDAIRQVARGAKAPLTDEETDNGPAERPRPAAGA